MLMMSNFTLGYNVYKSRLLQMHQNASAGGKGLNNDVSSDNNHCFHQLTCMSLNVVIKQKHEYPEKVCV